MTTGSVDLVSGTTLNRLRLYIVLLRDYLQLSSIPKVRFSDESLASSYWRLMPLLLANQEKRVNMPHRISGSSDQTTNGVE